MHFVFVVNDIAFGEVNVKAEDIIEYLLDKETWLFTAQTPNLKKISKGDKVILYMAGKGRRYFLASFEIAEEIGPRIDFDNKIKELNLSFFNLSAKLKNISRWSEPIPISEVKDSLQFISDKKNYGLFFRQSTKLINETDYSFLINKSVRKTVTI